MLFRQVAKSWRADAAIIILHDIPVWFVKLPFEYQKAIANSILPKYLAQQSKVTSLLRYRASGQLDVAFIDSYMGAYSNEEIRRANLVDYMPIPIAKSLVLCLDGLGKIRNWIRECL